MKRFLSVAFAVLMIAGLSACKKDYTCTCTYDDGTTTVTQDYPYGKQSKKDAQDACEQQESVWKLADPNATCEL